MKLYDIFLFPKWKTNKQTRKTIKQISNNTFIKIKRLYPCKGRTLSTPSLVASEGVLLLLSLTIFALKTRKSANPNFHTLAILSCLSSPNHHMLTSDEVDATVFQDKLKDYKSRKLDKDTNQDLSKSDLSQTKRIWMDWNLNEVKVLHNNVKN